MRTAGDTGVTLQVGDIVLGSRGGLALMVYCMFLAENVPISMFEFFASMPTDLFRGVLCSLCL